MHPQNGTQIQKFMVIWHLSLPNILNLKMLYNIDMIGGLITKSMNHGMVCLIMVMAKVIFSMIAGYNGQIMNPL